MLDAVFPLDGRIVVAIAAILLAGFAKGVTGIGLPVIGVPIMVALYGDLRAVLLVTVFATALSDIPFVVQGAKHARGVSFLAGFIGAGLVGVVLGTYLLVAIRPAILTFVLALVLIVFVAVQWLGKMPRMSRLAATRWGWLIGLAAGVLQGSAGASGPLTTSYLVSLDLPRDVFLFSINAIFLVLDWTLLVSLQRLGLYTPHLYALCAGIVALSAAGMVVGIAAGKRIDDAVFRRGVLLVLMVAVLSLLIRSLRG